MNHKLLKMVRKIKPKRTPAKRKKTTQARYLKKNKDVISSKGLKETTSLL